MLNLILTVLPALGGLLGAGKGGDLIAAGAKVAQEVFGTTDERTIADRLASDPALAEQFKAKLAAETATLQAQIADIQDARATTVKLAESGSAIAWGPVIISVLVVIGFLGMAILLMFRQVPDSQLAIVVFTTLSTGFGMVLQYWLGSSAGSKSSGDAIRQIAQAAVTPTPGQVAGRVIDAAVNTAAKR